MDTIKNTAKRFMKGLFNPDNKLSLIPNWLSFSRVIGGVAIPVMAYSGTSLPILFGTVSFLAISDFLDGKAARFIAKEETKEGAMMDAVSDKIFSLTLIIGILPILPVFAINGVLEGAIAIINSKLLSKGGSPKSNFFGKIKIWPLSIALILGYTSLAIQDLSVLGITGESLLAASTVLSAATIPLQGINIKQYFDEYKKHSEHNEETKQDEITIEKPVLEDSLESIKKPKLSLSRENHQAMVYELDKSEEEVLEKGKAYTKKDKH